MDGMEIMNSFNRETIYEFSEAVPAFDDEIYFIFKVDIISFDLNQSKSKRNKVKKQSENSNNGNFISHINIEPMAYILKTKTENECKYEIESLDEKYDSFVEKNKNKILEDFLKNAEN